MGVVAQEEPMGGFTPIKKKCNWPTQLEHCSFGSVNIRIAPQVAKRWIVMLLKRSLYL